MPMQPPRARSHAGARASILAALLLAAACRTGAPRLATDRLLEPQPQRDAQQALFLADLRRGDSLDRTDLGAPAASFTDDAIYLYPGLPVLRGAAAVRAVLRAAGSGAAVIRWQPVRAEASRDGEFGYTVGYALRRIADSAGVVRLDRYQAVWVRDEGRWRIVAYSELPEGPLPPAAVADSFRYRGSATAEGAAGEAAQADRDFAADAARSGTGTAFAAWAAADALLGGGAGQVATGPVAIQRVFGARRPNSSLVWSPVFARAAASGDLALTVGEAVSTNPGRDGAPVSRNSKYLTVWRRTPAGMRWVTDGGNAR